MKIKSINLDEKELVTTYEVSHSTGMLSTTLEQDFVVKINRETGKVEASMNLTALTADSVEDARQKMSVWLERMAVAMREPMEATPFVTEFKSAHEVVLRPHEQVEYDRIVSRIRTQIMTESNEGADTDKLEDLAYSLAKEAIKEIKENKHPFVYISRINDMICKDAMDFARGLKE